MVLSVSQTYTAIAPNLTSSFLANGGTPPYTYAVIPGGAGGSIDAGTGLYTAAAFVDNNNPLAIIDNILVTDSTVPIALTVQARILIGTPMLLFCDIIQNQMGLPDGRIYLWDQKLYQPTNAGLYVAVSVPMCKPIGNVNKPIGPDQSAYIAMQATVDIDAISRDASARDRKEEILIALNSQYSEQQQEANSFYIARMPTQFVNLSYIDGAAIPYRYHLSVSMQYAYNKTLPNQYFDTFTNPPSVIED